MAWLETINEGAGGSRHYLDGEPVHCGDALDIWRNGAWVPVRYERTWLGNGEWLAVVYYSKEDAWLVRPDDDFRWSQLY